MMLFVKRIFTIFYDALDACIASYRLWFVLLRTVQNNKYSNGMLMIIRCTHTSCRGQNGTDRNAFGTGKKEIQGQTSSFASTAQRIRIGDNQVNDDGERK